MLFRFLLFWYAAAGKGIPANLFTYFSSLSRAVPSVPPSTA